MADIQHHNDSPSTGRLLTVREVARILQISRSHVYLLIYSGQLPTVRFGRSMRLHPDDVEALKNQRTGAVVRHKAETKRVVVRKRNK